MYKSLSDWQKQLKEDWSDIFRRDGKIANRMPEQILILIANYILIFTLFNMLISYLGGITEFSKQVVVSSGLLVLFQVIVSFLKAIDLKIAERFSLAEINNFEFKPQCQLYMVFLSLNILLLIIVKYFPILLLKKLFKYEQR